MRKNKLDSIRKLFDLREKSHGHKLQRLREERRKHQEQTEALHALMAQYRAEHAQNPTMSAQQVLRFKRFYQQIVDTLAAQGEHAGRLGAAEDAQRDAWQDAYRQRLGIERVLDKKLYIDREASRRKERRTQPRPPGSGSWSTLNEDV